MGKTGKSDYTKIKNFCSSKEVIKGKSQPHVREAFAVNIIKKGFVSEIHNKYITDH